MATCIPFLRVPDIAKTIEWYQRIGFKCTGVHQEPGCDLDWAQLQWEDAVFMLYPEGRIASVKDGGLYFQLGSIEGVVERLEGKATIIESTDETEYGMSEVVFRDINNFQVTFGCPAHGKQKHQS